MNYKYQSPIESSTIEIIYYSKNNQESIELIDEIRAIGDELKYLSIYFLLIEEEETMAYSSIITQCMNQINDFIQKAPDRIRDHPAYYEEDSSKKLEWKLSSLSLKKLNESTLPSIFWNIRERVKKRNMLPCLVQISLTHQGFDCYFNVKGKEEIFRQLVSQHFTKYEDIIPPFDGF